MKITDIIVSDDVRREEGNKRTIVGTYSDKMFFLPNDPQWPTLKVMGFYFRIIREKEDPVFNNYKGIIFLKPSGKSDQKTERLLDFSGGIKGDSERVFTVDFVLPLNLPGPGTISLGFQLLNDQNKIEEITRDVIDIEVKVFKR